MSSTNPGSNLKRKNEEIDLSQTDQLNKRVALDSEQVALSEKQEEDAHTAPAIGTTTGAEEEADEQEEQEVEDAKQEFEEDTQEANDKEQQESEEEASPVDAPVDVPADVPAVVPAALDAGAILENISAAAAAAAAAAVVAPPSPSPPPPQQQQQQHQYQYQQQQYQQPSYEAHDQSSYSGSIESDSKPISNHREKEGDPTYVMFRMFCPVKEASAVVGKKGEKINHIREKANVRINVSDNLKNVPERIVSVRGPAENVARAFGLIARTILEEPEDEPASMLSKPYDLKLLVPHPMVGYIIGKQGTKFREIEENSAAKLKAAEQPLPYSTDRVLSITGVGDAIHIAIYYISQVMIEHKECLKKNKVIFYNPANYIHGTGTFNQQQGQPQQPGQPQQLTQQQQYQQQAGGNYNQYNNNMGGLAQQPYQHSQQQKPYDFGMMFQPTQHPQQYGAPVPNPSSQMMGGMNHNMGGNGPIAPQNPYTDEHGNTIVGDVITNAPVPVGSTPDKFNEDIFVANENIGSVIGKGGNNIKQIRLNSGCSYVKIEPDQRQSIMLGGGKGLTNIRKLTLTGSIQAINTAIYLINQRIAVDKERNGH